VDSAARGRRLRAVARLLPGVARRFLAVALAGLGAAAPAFAAGSVPLLWFPAAPLLLGLLAWTLRDSTRWFVGFAAASLLLPPLPFSPGDSGPHVAVLFAAIGLWRGATRSGQWRVPRNLLTLSAMALGLAMLLSVAFAMLYSGPRMAAGSFARVALFAISLYTLFYFAYGPAAGDAPEPLRWARRLYVLGIAAALFACVDFYFQIWPPAGFAEQFVWLPSGVYRRAQGMFYESGVLGNLCSFFLVWMALAWLRPARQDVSPAILVAGGVVLSAALLFSFSRSSLLNVSAALAALLVFCRKQLKLRRLLPLVLTAAAGGLLLTYLLFPSFIETYLLRLWYSGLELAEKPDSVLGGRLTTWSTILGLLAASPAKLLFGVGFKSLPSGGLAGDPIIADNMYVSMLAETGLLGLAAMLLFQAAILHNAYRAARSPDETASLLGAWIFCFWIGELFQMLSVDALTYWRVLPLYFAVLGLAVRERDRYDRGGLPSA
jgi:O-antigen ligase